MGPTERGIKEQSVCYTTMPGTLAQDLLFYGTWCGHYFCTSEYRMNRAYYPYILVLYMCSGKLTVEYDGVTLVADKGDVLLLDCSRAHYWQAEEQAEFYYMYFCGSNSRELCDHIISEYGWWIRRKNNVLVRDLLKEELDVRKKNKVENPMTGSLRIYRIMEILTDVNRNQDSMEMMVSQSVQFIHEHLDEPITLEMLSDQANLSVYYYSHCFKERMGIAPMEYVINARIEKAKILLVRTNLSIDDVAASVGYSTARSLINRFRKYVGMTPARYRKEYHNV